jgi:lantibiotic leader peptide-processing serine protease
MHKKTHKKYKEIKLMKKGLLMVLILLLLVVGIGSAQETSQSYLVIAPRNGLSAAAEKSIAAAGGTISKYFPQIGVAVVESNNPDFAASVTGVEAVVRDMPVSVPDTLEAEQTVSLDALPQPPFTGDDDFFFDLQWGHTSVRAQEAWAAGQRGAGVRVFILDEGFDLDHPDLAPNYNLALSTTFVPGTTDAQYLLPDTFSHGSHTSGTIGAADNAFGTIGVAPEVEMVPVKVLSENLGYGDFSWVIEGILYAADNGADVINMSLGTIIPQGLGPDSSEVAALRVAVNRAITYAYQNGATVVVSAGNDGYDLNDPSTASFINFQGYASHAISVSSVAPIGWATDPGNIDLNQPTGYSNYGPEIDFAAPGGNFVYPGNEGCIIAGLLRPCWVFDYVFSTGNGGWYWSVGTSMAAPHAAGVAALIIGENGGDMHPARVKAEMRSRAVDLGKRGSDDIYGYGVATSGY